jgi:thiol-disulfide isomerase/thioredoxin
MLRQQYQQTMRAPELYGDQWFNSAPLSIRAAEGQNILLFFWNYTSPSSLLMLQTIKEWFENYAGLGLICIGVHAPEFAFAKQQKKVEEIILKYGITFPVVSDNERLIAEAYRITDFPAVVLIGGNGNVYDVVTQMFSIARLERSIQYLLRQSGFFGELPMLRSIEAEQSEIRHVSELTTGYLHGSLGNAEGYSPELEAEYRDPQIYIEGKFYAHGIWRAERNAFHYTGAPNEGYLVCHSGGENIDALIGSEQKASVGIKVDDASMLLEQMNADIKRDAKGNTCISVAEPQFASVFRGANRQQHAVKFIPMQTGITFYKFSFYKEHLPSGETHQIRNN